MQIFAGEIYILQNNLWIDMNTLTLHWNKNFFFFFLSLRKDIVATLNLKRGIMCNWRYCVKYLETVEDTSHIWILYHTSEINVTSNCWILRINLKLYIWFSFRDNQSNKWFSSKIKIIFLFVCFCFSLHLQSTYNIK